MLCGGTGKEMSADASTQAICDKVRADIEAMAQVASNGGGGGEGGEFQAVKYKQQVRHEICT
jgi:hypothetical protein